MAAVFVHPGIQAECVEVCTGYTRVLCMSSHPDQHARAGLRAACCVLRTRPSTSKGLPAGGCETPGFRVWRDSVTGTCVGSGPKQRGWLGRRRQRRPKLAAACGAAGWCVVEAGGGGGEGGNLGGAESQASIGNKRVCACAPLRLALSWTPIGTPCRWKALGEP